MNVRIYVANLPYSYTASQVRDIFSIFGPVVSLNLGHPGTAFIEMNEIDGSLAISNLHQHRLEKRRMTVRPAKKQVAKC